MDIIHDEVKIKMDRVIMLSDIKREKKKNDLRMNVDSSNDIFNSIEKYSNFNNKFCKGHFNSNNINLIDVNILSEFINKIFLLSNKKPFIDFVNEIFDDCLGTNCEITYVNNGSQQNVESRILNNLNCNIKVLARDYYRVIEYSIQFCTEDYDNIAIIISRNKLSSEDTNIINLEQKKHKYKIKNTNHKQLSNGLDSYLIMVNSNIRVPDSYEVKEENGGDNICYRFNILKGWKYDFKNLYKNNLYLLFPLKVVDLKKHITYMKEFEYSNETIDKEICRFFDEMNKYLNMIKIKKRIEDEDIKEFNIISRQILKTI